MAVYKLSCSLLGHSMDIRCVTVLPNTIDCGYSGTRPEVVTGSRDRTAKVWTPLEGSTVGYRESRTLCGHTNFVSCVGVAPPDDQYPRGLILTGSNDKTICAFPIGAFSSDDGPVYRLVGHDNTVCSLSVGQFGTVLSGSWDQTARVWLRQKCLMTLKGHSATVWAVVIVAQLQGTYLTASADKTIKLWKLGKCELTFEGHTDCVRALSVASHLEFLSAANDGTVRRWLFSGECVSVIAAHDSYVYGVAVLPDGLGFVTAGEDRTLRTWSNAGKNLQIVRHPAQSVWTVAVLPDGDIVTGASDGVARIFSRDPGRQASADEITTFEEEVGGTTLSSGELGNIKINDLPGKEVLYEPGKRDGQTKLVRDGSKVGVYQWSGAESRWLKIGDAVGSAGTQAPGGKIQFEGKEYDYVFDVDIEDGKPPLKLPYNITEDPWFAAQKFIERNDISQMFLDQVANFILKNTEGITLGTQQPSASSGDPFTGQTRYIPGESLAQPSSGTDPFTGAGRYVPSSGQPDVGAQPSNTLKASNAFFPQRTLLTFDSGNLTAITGKLKEFCTQNGSGDEALTDGEIDEVVKLAEVESICSAGALNTLHKILRLPKELVFPAMDLLRLAIRHPIVCEHFCGNATSTTSDDFLIFVLSHLSINSPPANQMLAMRTLCNMANSSVAGKRVIELGRNAVMEALLQLMPSDNRNVQIAFATVLLNYAVLLLDSHDLEAKVQCLSGTSCAMAAITDPEAQFRLLVAIGTLVADDEESLAFARSLDLLPSVRMIKAGGEPHKVTGCAAAIEELLAVVLHPENGRLTVLPLESLTRTLKIGDFIVPLIDNQLS